jgi:methionyl aminopeptidase
VEKSFIRTDEFDISGLLIRMELVDCPRHIWTPPYERRRTSNYMARIMAITIHTAEDIKRMRIAGRLASEVLDFITPYVKPGITTGDLDRLCHDYIVDLQHAIPACLNYFFPGHTPFPKSICTSVNEVACHGIPDDRVLKDGDIINIDVTVIKDGYHGDNARMFYVGSVAPAARRLCEIAFECMWLGIEQVRPEAHVGDIGFAIQRHAEKHGVSVIPELWGHGIGKKFHDEPSVPHIGVRGTLDLLLPGMTFTIEPIINAGQPGIKGLADGWTIATVDNSLSAQWEHTVLVTEVGYEVLTTSAGTPARPEKFLARELNAHEILVG